MEKTIQITKISTDSYNGVVENNPDLQARIDTFLNKFNSYSSTADVLLHASELEDTFDDLFSEVDELFDDKTIKDMISKNISKQKEPKRGFLAKKHVNPKLI